MNRALIIVLALSLAANVFLGGFVVGRLAGGHPHIRFGHAPHAAGPMMFPDLDVLSPEGREAFRDVFAARREALRERHRDLNERRAAFAKTLAADPWDRAKAEAALVELQAAADEQETAFATLIIDAFEKLSAEDRKALVEAGAGHWRLQGERLHKRRMKHGNFPPSPEDEDAPLPPPAD